MKDSDNMRKIFNKLNVECTVPFQNTRELNMGKVNEYDAEIEKIMPSSDDTVTQALDPPTEADRYFIRVHFIQINGKLHEEDKWLSNYRNCIGRNSGDLNIEDPAVSKHHADIIYQDGKIYIQDKGSTNHTYIDGKPLFGNDTMEISNDTVIQVGRSKFKIYTPEQQG